MTIFSLPDAEETMQFDFALTEDDGESEGERKKRVKRAAVRSHQKELKKKKRTERVPKGKSLKPIPRCRAACPVQEWTVPEHPEPMSTLTLIGDKTVSPALCFRQQSRNLS